jgi:hypothetical protein
MKKKFICVLVAVLIMQFVLSFSISDYNVIAVSNIKKSYIDLVNSLYDIDDLFCEYMLYDIDQDGTTELIYSKGTCEADHYMLYYTYDAGRIVKLGETGGSWSAIYKTENAKGVYWYYAIQGCESKYLVNKVGNSINVKTIFEFKESDIYTPPKNHLKTYLYDDYSGINKFAIDINFNEDIENISYSQTSNSINLKWSKVEWASGYRIYKYDSDSKKYKAFKTVSKNKYTIEKLKSGSTYKFKIRPYLKLDTDNVIWGEYSDVIITATKPSKPTIKVTSTSIGKANVSWSNVSGESGYQVYYSTKKDSDYKKINNFKANETKSTKSNLKSEKIYYFKVRAYKKVDGKIIYGSFSSVKSVKIK